MTEIVSSERELIGFARGKPGDWEAICIDLDIAVQGRSFAEVQRLLNEAVADYLATVAEIQDEDQRVMLLTRATPLRTTLLWTFRVLWSIWHNRKRHDDSGSASLFPIAALA